MISNKFVEKFSKKKNRVYEEDEHPISFKKFKDKKHKKVKYKDEYDEYDRNSKKTNRRP